MEVQNMLDLLNKQADSHEWLPGQARHQSNQLSEGEGNDSSRMAADFGSAAQVMPRHSEGHLITKPC